MKWILGLSFLMVFEMHVVAVSGEQQGQTAANNTMMIPWDCFSMGCVINAPSEQYRSTGIVATLPAAALHNDQFLLFSGFLNPDFTQALTLIREGHDAGMPKTFQLMQNYPNPFNPSTTILYTLPEKSTIRLDIYDLLGRRITTLWQGDQEPGVHMVNWNGHDGSGRQISTGVYFYRLHVYSAKGRTIVYNKKMMFVK